MRKQVQKRANSVSTDGLGARVDAQIYIGVLNRICDQV